MEKTERYFCARGDLRLHKNWTFEEREGGEGPTNWWRKEDGNKESSFLDMHPQKTEAAIKLLSSFSLSLSSHLDTVTFGP